ncbi:MAG: tetratricopeptide repeat protein [Spirochaetota bacterium]|nr:tetratricopeptide repeat protein [Spirochaetota bacterium]
MTKRFILFVFFIVFTAVSLNTQTSNPLNNDTAYSSDTLNRLYIVGLQYLNNNELTQAEISFRSIIAFPFRNKDWRTTRYYKAKAHFYLGDIYFIQKKYDKASFNYQQIVQEYAEIEEYSYALYKLGRSLILNNKELEGIDVLKDYNYNYGTKDLNADNTLYWIAQGYISLENYNAALQILHQILRDFPNSGMAYDIRILISKLETTPSASPISQNLKQSIQNNIDSSRKIMDNITEEKELVDRMKQVLTIKEQLLHLKERKLNLLESVAQTRVKALKEKNINTKK